MFLEKNYKKSSLGKKKRSVKFSSMNKSKNVVGKHITGKENSNMAVREGSINNRYGCEENHQFSNIFSKNDVKANAIQAENTPTVAHPFPPTPICPNLTTC